MRLPPSACDRLNPEEGRCCYCYRCGDAARTATSDAHVHLTAGAGGYRGAERLISWAVERVIAGVSRPPCCCCSIAQRGRRGCRAVIGGQGHRLCRKESRESRSFLSFGPSLTPARRESTDTRLVGPDIRRDLACSSGRLATLLQPSSFSHTHTRDKTGGTRLLSSSQTISRRSTALSRAGLGSSLREEQHWPPSFE